jgi:hypothetical protein
MVCVDNSDTRVYKWPMRRNIVLPLIMILIIIIMIPFMIFLNVNGNLLAIPVLVILIEGMKKKDPTLIGMKFCDACYSRLKKLNIVHTKLMFVFFGILILTVVISQIRQDLYYLPTISLIGLIILRFFYDLYKCPMCFSRGKAGASILFPDKRYKKIFEDFQALPDVKTKANGEAICSNCGNSGVEGKKSCEKCGEIDFGDKI